jgi:hypothetical protein
MSSEIWEAYKVMGFWRLLWAWTGYRPFARFAHRHNWHHTRALGPFDDGAIQHRCEWCGWSYTVRRPDYKKMIHKDNDVCQANAKS